MAEGAERRAEGTAEDTDNLVGGVSSPAEAAPLVVEEIRRLDASSPTDE
jgi:hypothetical protein